MNKVKLITLDPTLLSWKTLNEKRKSVIAMLNQAKNSDFVLDIEYQEITPEVVNGRITHAYMDLVSKPFLDKGYDFVGLHLGSKQWKKYKLQKSLRGIHQVDKDEVMEIYFWADEHSKREGLDQFQQEIGHEFSHGYHRGSKQLDMTHAWHDATGDISGIFKTFDMNLYQPDRVAMRSLIEVLKAELTRLTTKSKLQPLVERSANAVIDDMAMLGHKVRIVEGYRSFDRQNQLYAQGRTTPGAIVTNAKGGESLHQYGVAVDFVFTKEGYNASRALWETLGITMEKRGFSWGARWNSFRDYPHGEMLLGYSLKDFQSGLVDYNKYK